VNPVILSKAQVEIVQTSMGTKPLNAIGCTLFPFSVRRALFIVEVLKQCRVNALQNGPSSLRFSWKFRADVTTIETV
jgi:hypothetical protein